MHTTATIAAIAASLTSNPPRVFNTHQTAMAPRRLSRFLLRGGDDAVAVARAVAGRLGGGATWERHTGRGPGTGRPTEYGVILLPH